MSAVGVDAPIEALREGFAQAVWLVAPAAGAAAAAALAVGWCCHRLGVADPAPVLLARAAAVLALLWWGGGAWLAHGAAWTRELWSQLPAIGQGQGE